MVRDSLIFLVISLSALTPIVAKTTAEVLSPVEVVMTMAQAESAPVAPDLTPLPRPKPEVEAVSKTTIMFGAAFDSIVALLLTGVTGLTGWLATQWRAAFKADMDARMKTTLHDGLKNGVLYASELIKEKLGHGMAVDVKNEMVAIAGQYMVDNSGAVLKYFKLDGRDPGDMTDLVVANAAKLGISTKTATAAG